LRKTVVTSKPVAVHVGVTSQEAMVTDGDIATPVKMEIWIFATLGSKTAVCRGPSYHITMIYKSKNNMNV
jgi:hypothetical protein